MDPIVLAFGTALVGAIATSTWQQVREAVTGLWRRVHPQQKTDDIGTELDDLREQVLLARRDGDTDTERVVGDVLAGRGMPGRVTQAEELTGVVAGAVGVPDQGEGWPQVLGDPSVLQALSQQATFRLVLLTRSAEMAQAVARALLQGAAAIELQDIDPGAAAGYLTRTQLDPAPHGWQELTSRLRQEPGSPLARALSNPLMTPGPGAARRLHPAARRTAGPL